MSLTAFSRKRPVVELLERAAEPGRAADVRIDDRDAELVAEIVAAADGARALALDRAAVHVDDHRPRAR